MRRSSPVDGFRLAYDREGSGPPVVLLHGWPGDRADYREVTRLLSDAAGIGVRARVLGFAFSLAAITYLDRICISAAAP